MAIQFARARYISRSSGGSAVRSAAYNGRESITAERTGELYYFRHRDAPEHHEVLLPEGAAERFRESGVLWNAAEAAEKRKDAQVAREIVLALPADAGISSEDRIELARSFAAEHFVAKGLAVQLDVHMPHEGAAESEHANWHAHLLITTRRLEGERFSTRKARDLDPEVRRAGGLAVVAEGEAWGELWRDHQNRYFQEHGIDLRVDPTATYAAPHIGPIRMRVAGSEIVERAEQIRRANDEAARDPAQVLATLTRHNATFTERDLDRHLGKHREAAAERATVKAQVLEHGDLVSLYDRETGKAAGRFTTRQVREQERTALADAATIAKSRTPAVPTHAARTALVGQNLRPDQRAAFDHAIGAGGLKLIEGRAGTGKSYALGVIRHTHELAGHRVVGLAPTNTVAQDLKADGFAEAGTVHAELFRLKNGRAQWTARTVVIVDEAAMLDSRITGELLAEARRTSAKVILAGDDRQLASIERGGLFSELTARHGAAEITEVTRQKVDWQRQAARDLAEGRFAAAVAAYDRAGAITWTADQTESRTALVEAWKRDTAATPGAARFVFAYTNRDVDALNAELRRVRRERGALAGPDVRFETKHGEAEFAIGDRVQFTDTDKKARVYNGNVGTITGIDARTGELRARLDSGRAVSWSAAEFPGFRHGYAGTIYKGQGKTLDHTYLYHTEHWRRAASYVALTRQRERAQVFVARATARDAAQLARQMARGEVKAASIAWATRDELAVEPARPAVEREPRATQPEANKSKQPPGDSLRAKVQAALEARQRGTAEIPLQDAVGREALRGELRAMDREALRQAAYADRVGSTWSERPMTVQDAARLVDPVYAAVADRTAFLREAAAAAEKQIEHYQGVLRHYTVGSDKRWQAMGFLRQAMHKAGVGKDRWMGLSEDGERRAADELDKLEPRRAKLARQLPEAEKEEAAAFERAQPAAAAELAKRQERASLAREIMAERRQEQDQARERQQEQRRDRDHGIER